MPKPLTLPKKPASGTPRYWMVKSEPESYSWSDFVRDKGTAWTGVRNFAARLNLAAMQKGDQVLFYHSVSEKAVVGIAKVVKTAYPDATAQEEGWLCVDLAPVKALSPISLAAIKEDPRLQELALIRQSRLSVMPVQPGEWDALLNLAHVLPKIKGKH